MPAESTPSKQALGRGVTTEAKVRKLADGLALLEALTADENATRHSAHGRAADHGRGGFTSIRSAHAGDSSLSQETTGQANYADAHSPSQLPRRPQTAPPPIRRPSTIDREKFLPQ